MSISQKFVVWGACFCGAALAESPQDAVRKAMEGSIARQNAAVIAMQVSIEKQRAAIAARSGASTAVPPADQGPAAPPPFFTLSWPALGAGCDPVPEQELDPLIQKAAQQAGLDAGLLRAVAQQESGFRSCAVSAKGALGLMQLMPEMAHELGVHDPFDPGESLLSGARLLKELLARFGGDTALALGAYNAGAERVERNGGIPPIPETIRYVQQILSKIPLP